MHDPTHFFYRAAQIRELDRLAIEESGIPGRELMERAGRAAFDALRARWPASRRLAVFCGGGNNGGDGYVVARLAHEAGLAVRLFPAVEPGLLKGDAAATAAAARAAGLPFLRPDEPLDAELVVDALLGTGSQGEARGAVREAILQIAQSGLPLFALDIPSGLDPDTGRVAGVAVRAEATISFIGLKQGLFTGAGPDCAGEVLFDDLGLPALLYQRMRPAARRLDRGALAALSPRPRAAHKGDFGHLLLVGGERGMGGAVRMAAEAALRVGAGLVSVATRETHAPLIAASRPELMCHGVEKRGDLRPLLARADVVAVGPGLGRGRWGRDLFGALLDSGKPLVVDADALVALAEEKVRREEWLLTPHPGEAARLLGMTTAEVQADRFAAVAAIQACFGGVVVLKGAGSLVMDGEGEIDLCTLGNPGMATGGTGDILTGVIAGIVAQGFALPDAARIGVALHGAAGDEAARDGERGMVASDLLPHLRRLANP